MTTFDGQIIDVTYEWRNKFKTVKSIFILILLWSLVISKKTASLNK